MIYDIIWIFWLHFIADFVLQTNYMALNKSKNTKALLIHTIAYSVPFFIWFIIDYTLELFLLYGLWFIVINTVSHFFVDYVTSRITSKLYEKQKYRLFFNVIGLDQAIHMSILVLTYSWLPVG